MNRITILCLTALMASGYSFNGVESPPDAQPVNPSDCVAVGNATKVEDDQFKMTRTVTAPLVEGSASGQRTVYYLIRIESEARDETALVVGSHQSTMPDYTEAQAFAKDGFRLNILRSSRDYIGHSLASLVKSGHRMGHLLDRRRSLTA